MVIAGYQRKNAVLSDQEKKVVAYNQYLGGDTSLSCSADTQKEIDEKVVQLVKAEHEKARKILAENREKLDELAMYLYEKETIIGDEFMDILDRK